jgi:hypothetical protein
MSHRNRWKLGLVVGLLTLIGVLGYSGASWVYSADAATIPTVPTLPTLPTVPTVATFDDVPTSHVHFYHVEAIYYAGITQGCSVTPPLYCPDAPVSRRQMALFLVRGLDGPTYVPTLPTVPSFDDVPPSDPDYGFIERLYQEHQITQGCSASPPLYCPDFATSRAQMAKFLVVASYGPSYTPPAATGIFADVPISDPFAPYIEQIYNDGISTGCAVSPLRFCPNDPVARAQMATFLARAFHLVP